MEKTGRLFLFALLGLFTRLGALGSVFGTATAAAIHSEGIKRATDDMVTDTGEILHTSAAHEHDRVLLKIVTFTANVGDDFLAVGQTHFGDLAKGGVRLLGCTGHHLNADAAALGTIHEGG